MAVTNVVTALTARTQLGQILRRATQENVRFVVGRRGEPTVIIMGLRDFIRTLAPAPQWLREVRAEAKRLGTERLTARQIDREIAAYRRERRGKKALK
jgi:prevent-host-death family protein